MATTQKEGNDKSVAGSFTHSGPEAQVILTHDTPFFRDVSWHNAAARGGGRPTKQELEVGDGDEAGIDSYISVWGEQQGDRVLARTMVYFLPKVLSK